MTIKKCVNVYRDIQIEDTLNSCVQCNLSFTMAKDLKTYMVQHDRKKPHQLQPVWLLNHQTCSSEKTHAGS